MHRTAITWNTAQRSSCPHRYVKLTDLKRNRQPTTIGNAKTTPQRSSFKIIVLVHLHISLHSARLFLVKGTILYTLHFKRNRYIAPSFVKTALNVFRRIRISRPILQWLMYSVSSLTTSSKFVILLLPLTCHIPVRPGFVASLAR